MLSDSDIFSEKRGRLYIETSFNKSNLLLLKNVYHAQKIDNIYYLGIGGGVNLALSKNKGSNLFLELAFFNYHVLNKIEFKSNYSQYIIGVNYRFGKLK